MITFGCEVRFSGSPVSGFCPPATTTNGTFTGELRRNPATFALEIWDSDEWLSAVSNGYTQLIGSVIGSSDINIGALGLRKTIRLSRGTGVLINTISQPTSAQATVYVDTGVVTCRPMNVAYVSVDYNDNNVATNNGSTLIGHYKDIETAMLKYASMGSTGQRYLIYVNAGNYVIDGVVDVPAHICLHLAPKAVISGHGSFTLTTGSQIMGDGDINVPIYVVAMDSTVEANYISRIGVSGWSNIRCTRLDNLYVSVSEYDSYNVHVDCIEIGNVRTGFVGVDEESYQPYPNVIQRSIGGVDVNVYCNCVASGTGTTWSCPYNTICMVGPAVMGEISEELMDYYSKNCILTIRANKRVANTKILVSVGNAKISYRDYKNNLRDVSDTYVSGLASAWERSSTLQIMDADESTIGLGYQVCGGAILRLNNVRHNSLTDGIPANIAQSSDGSLSSRVSLRGTMLTLRNGTTSFPNVSGVQISGYNLMDLASFDSYGNNATPAVNCNQVLGTTLGYTSIQQDIWA